MGYKVFRYNIDSWIKSNQTRYDFIVNLVNDFIIVAKNAVLCTKEFNKFFSLRRKGLLEYFLENNY